VGEDAVVVAGADVGAGEDAGAEEDADADVVGISSRTRKEIANLLRSKKHIVVNDIFPVISYFLNFDTLVFLSL